MSDVAAAIDTLRARFLTRSKDDLAALRLWSSAGAAPDDDHHRILHRLAGAAGTFGFSAISEHAKAVEDLVVAGRAGDGPELRALIEALGQATTAPVGGRRVRSSGSATARTTGPAGSGR